MGERARNVSIMPMSQALLPEFDHEMANTRKALERVPEEKFGWKPHEKSMTLGRLATHVAELTGRSAAARSRSCYPHIGVRAQIRPTPPQQPRDNYRTKPINWGIGLAQIGVLIYV